MKMEAQIFIFKFNRCIHDYDATWLYSNSDLFFPIASSTRTGNIWEKLSFMKIPSKTGRS